MISDGQIDMGIGAGVESMSQNYGAGVMPEKVSACGPFPFQSGQPADCDPAAQMSEVVLANQQAADCLIPMGITSTCPTTHTLPTMTLS